MRPLGEDGERLGSPNALDAFRPFRGTWIRGTRASAPPCTAPAPLHVQEQRSTAPGGAAEGGGGGFKPPRGRNLKIIFEI